MFGFWVKKRKGGVAIFSFYAIMRLLFGVRGAKVRKRKSGKKRGEEVLEDYAKAVLYAYPLLETVGKDYEEHIYNKAILSYRSEKRAEELAEYIAGEILEQRKLVWLKDLLERVLRGLSETENAFIAVRYFGKGGKIKRAFDGAQKIDGGLSEGKYFRLQRKLGNKIGERLVALGLSKEVFERDFGKMKMFQGIFRRMQRKGLCIVEE